MCLAEEMPPAPVDARVKLAEHAEMIRALGKRGVGYHRDWTTACFEMLLRCDGFQRSACFSTRCQEMAAITNAGPTATKNKLVGSRVGM